MAPDIEIWCEGGNRGDQLEYNIEIENKAFKGYLWWHHHGILYRPITDVVTT